MILEEQSCCCLNQKVYPLYYGDIRVGLSLPASYVLILPSINAPQMDFVSLSCSLTLSILMFYYSFQWVTTLLSQ